MHPEIETLATLLEEAECLLRRHDVTHWAEWLHKDATRIRGLDLYGLEHLLSAFGGMGSLNDLILARPKEDDPSILDTSPDDEKFQGLLSRIRELAGRLYREEVGGNGRT
jgi:hypothetical protein